MCCPCSGLTARLLGTVCSHTLHGQCLAVQRLSALGSSSSHLRLPATASKAPSTSATRAPLPEPRWLLPCSRSPALTLVTLPLPPGVALRVPTPTVSVVDLVVQVEKKTFAEEVNEAFREAANGPLKGILAVRCAPRHLLPALARVGWLLGAVGAVSSGAHWLPKRLHGGGLQVGCQ